ncbi:MAG: hypothetical protein AB1772_13320 [Candidatus Zixiibacteriota bacterium]
MARKILTHLDLSKNELQNAVLGKLATAPSSPVTGQMYYNTTDNTGYMWNGTVWEDMTTSAGAGSTNLSTTLSATTVIINSDTGGDASIPSADGTNAGIMTSADKVKLNGIASGATANSTDTFLLDRANHTGAQAISTVTGLQTALDNKVDENAAITGATATKITYDAKGLVTAGAAATTTDIAEGTNLYYTAARVQSNRLDQLAAPTAAVSLNNQKITSLANPTTDSDAATKAYADSIAQGLDFKASVRAATTANGALTTAFANGSVIDGVTLVTGNRILIKDQTTGSENGIYTVNATGAPTRALDADSNTEVTSGMFAFVEEGTTNADTGWVLNNNGAITLGTTALAFTQFSSAGVPTAGTGLTKTGNTFAIDNTVATLAGTQTLTNKTINLTSNTLQATVAQLNTATGDTLVTAAGTQTLTNKSISGGQITSAVANATTAVNVSGTVAIANGGTGQTTAAAARTALGAVGIHTQTIGDGAATSIIVTHNLGNQFVTACVYEVGSTPALLMVECDVSLTSATTTTFTFATAPTAGQYRVVITG